MSIVESQPLYFNEPEKSGFITEGNRQKQKYRKVKKTRKKNRCNTCYYKAAYIHNPNYKPLMKTLYCGYGGFLISAPKSHICDAWSPKIYNKVKVNKCLISQ